jgi:hypothetical protein
MSERKRVKRKTAESKEPRQATGGQRTGLGAHGAEELPAVILTSYNLQLQDEEGFIGNRAGGRAFRALPDELHAQISEVAEDPLDNKLRKELTKKQLLIGGDTVAAGMVQGATETMVILHNDAVVQGLSEALFMRDLEHWAVLTIGTGLGNASFENRKA